MGDASFSVGMLLGAIAGIGIGVSIGIAMGRKQKSWSELTDSEKKTRIVAITAGVVLLVSGVVVFLVLFLT
ncbi:hypothetical protein ACFLX4_02080 [Chloroflexota bacterium]